PLLLRPQQYSALPRRPQVKRLPDEMAVQPVSVPTRVGTRRLTMLPSPTWWLLFRPQQYSSPLLRVAHTCSSPIETCCQSSFGPTRVGATLTAVELSPPAPKKLRPQQYSVLMAVMAQVSCVPAD